MERKNKDMAKKNFFADTEDTTKEILTKKEPTKKAKATPKKAEPKEEAPADLPKPYYAYRIPADQVRNASIHVMMRKQTAGALKTQAKRQRISGNELLNRILSEAVKSGATYERSCTVVGMPKNRRLILKTTQKLSEELRKQAYACQISTNDYINQATEQALEKKE